MQTAELPRTYARAYRMSKVSGRGGAKGAAGEGTREEIEDQEWKRESACAPSCRPDPKLLPRGRIPPAADEKVRGGRD